MTYIRKFQFSEHEISFILKDTNSSEYLWLGFSQDSSGNCALKKVSAHNPLRTYFDVDIAVDELVKAKISGSYIYIAIDDSSLIGRKYSIASPLATPTDFDLPTGITEAPVDIIVDTYVYFLIPGSSSGTNAKICIFSTSGTFSETIDLSGITNASSFTIDDNDDLWIATNDDPAQLIRVYDDGGWQTATTTL